MTQGNGLGFVVWCGIADGDGGSVKSRRTGQNRVGINRRVCAEPLAYLYTILVGLADKVEASAEAQSEAQRRAPPAATYQVRGQAMPMGQALDQMFGGRDPTLAKLDARDKTVAPMPQAARDQLAALKRNKPV